jgi:hypothetical protein
MAAPIIKATPDLPARLFGGNAQAVEVTGLDYTLHLDISKLPDAGATVSANKWTVVWDEGQNLYQRVAFDQLPVPPTDWSQIPNKPATFPPTLPIDWSQVSGKPATFPPDAHTHPASAVTDFAEAVDDRVGALVVAGAGITVTYADTPGTLTIASTSAAGVADGDKGDVVVSSSGTVWTVKSGVVTIGEVAGLQGALDGKVAKAGDTMTGALVVSNATASSSPTTGALTVAGGVGIGSALNVAGLTASRGAAAGFSFEDRNDAAKYALWYMQANATRLYSSAYGEVLNVNNSNGDTRIPSLTASTSTTTGALVVAGGAGIAGALNVGGIIKAGSGQIDVWGYAGDTAASVVWLNSAHTNYIYTTAAGVKFVTDGLGFYNTPPVARPAVTGSRGGNAALTSLLTALAAFGLITNSTTA